MLSVLQFSDEVYDTLKYALILAFSLWGWRIFNLFREVIRANTPAKSKDEAPEAENAEKAETTEVTAVPSSETPATPASTVSVETPKEPASTPANELSPEADEFVKRSRVARHRGWLVEAYYWLEMAEAKDGVNLLNARMAIRREWMKRRFDGEYQHISNDFTETQGTLGRSCLRMDCRIDAERGRMHLLKFVDAGNEDAIMICKHRNLKGPTKND